MRNHSSRRIPEIVLAALTAAVLLVAAALPATAMTVTFVRHGESAGNASGFIDTSVPGPDLTPLGQSQAQTVAAALVAGGVGYDAVYASNMVRTSQTAQPLLAALGLPLTVQPGFREINAGVFEGQSQDAGLGRIGYGMFPFAWALGARLLPVPGSEDGNSFDARVDDALEEIEDSGAQNPVVFSHGATMMFWTMMNVDNPDLFLIFTHPLGNTDVVVVEGSTEAGWTLKSWAGRAVGPASLGTRLFVNVRDLVVTPQTSVHNVAQAFSSGDISRIATAIRDGVLNTVAAPVKFAAAVVRDVVDSVAGAVRPPSVNAPAVQAKTAQHDTATPEVTDVDQVEGSIPADVMESPKTNGATDLSDGNKATPGVTHDVAEPDQGPPDAVESVTDHVEASVTDISDAIQNVSENATAQTDDSRDDGDTGESAATSEKDAA